MYTPRCHCGDAANALNTLRWNACPLRTSARGWSSFWAGPLKDGSNITTWGSVPAAQSVKYSAIGAMNGVIRAP